MTDTLSFQCLLQQDSTRITAWIEARGASKGARVAIEGGAGLWEVAEVYQPPRSATWLNENARKVHKGLPAWTRTTDGCPSGKGTRC